MTVLQDTLARQQAACRATAPTDKAARKSKLAKLRRQIIRYQDVFAEAANADFRGRPAFESRLIEVIGTLWVLNHARRNVGKWMRPEKRAPQAMFAGPNSLKVTYQPKGVVGIVAPWNMPLYLSLGPLVTAIAAGNRAMIKLPEETPQANEVIRRIVAETFDADEVAVFGGEITDPAEFTSLPFDHLVFTGSPRVGRIVMSAAAKNLTPVTLELGGKSPAIVAPDYSIQDAALRITHGKIAMSGQVCVAPDYAIVPRDQVDAFAGHVKDVFNQFYPNGVVERPEYCSLANDRHHERMKTLLEDARQKGATILATADWDGGPKMPIHVVTGVTEDMLIAQEEVFGPILPVIPHDGIDQALSYVAGKPRPLALYMFTKKKSQREKVLEHSHSGGVTVNDWGWHVVNAAVPFGGVGNSGFGSYHGIEGFRELSKAKPVFVRHPLFPTEMFHPPVLTGGRGIFQKFWMNFYSKKGDPSLRLNQEQE